MGGAGEEGGLGGFSAALALGSATAWRVMPSWLVGSAGRCFSELSVLFFITERPSRWAAPEGHSFVMDGGETKIPRFARMTNAVKTNAERKHEGRRLEGLRRCFYPIYLLCQF